MDKLIASFTLQLRDAVSIGKKASLNCTQSINNVLITGLGGSGIGGRIASDLLAEQLTVPIVVNNNYQIPAWVNQNTLVIANSYSGNTEETIMALEEAIQKTSNIVCVTSGGKMEEIIRKNNLNCIIIPGGNPPRAALAYSLVQQLFILTSYKVALKSDFENDLLEAADLLDNNETVIQEKAKKIAKELVGKTAVIYAADGYEGIAVRLKQQINENAKSLCWHDHYPEMNHNELVGWAGGNPGYAVILFRNNDDFDRVKVRMNISKTIITRYTPTFIEVFSEGKGRVQQSMYLIHLGDWISYFLSVEKGIDAIEVKVIDYLKSELSKI